MRGPDARVARPGFLLVHNRILQVGSARLSRRRAPTHSSPRITCWRHNSLARTRPMCPRAKVIKRADAVSIEPRYEAEVAERLGMTLQILFGVVGMSTKIEIWLFVRCIMMRTLCRCSMKVGGLCKHSSRRTHKSLKKSLSLDRLIGKSHESLRSGAIFLSSV
jgi:hypothetical protein